MTRRCKQFINGVSPTILESLIEAEMIRSSSKGHSRPASDEDSR